ncbi:ferredoxin [Candidatus Parcubacteria bacterium]|jgi:ferredoxin|nr:ferredoxin [Candidatus Parcubacteria bacterium]
MKIEVARELCTSVATCIAVAPGTFELDDEGIAIIKDIKGDDEKTILQAAQSCPVNAIILYDDNGKQIHPPK